MIKEALWDGMDRMVIIGHRYSELIIFTTTSDTDVSAGARSRSGTRPAMAPGVDTDENFAK